MTKEFNVYLCGPMAANTPEQANGWRLKAFEYLEPYGITIVSPMREKDMIEKSTLMGVDYEKYGDVPELRAASIWARDTYDVDHANLVLANFTDLGYAKSGEPIPSLGSDMELARAEAHGTKIVMVAPPGNYYRQHPFAIMCADIVFDELAPACEWVVRNFKPYLSNPYMTEVSDGYRTY